ncbi:hypothetical protein X801_07355, partial [Opisthorchis viverrini]
MYGAISLLWSLSANHEHGNERSSLIGSFGAVMARAEIVAFRDEGRHGRTKDYLKGSFTLSSYPISMRLVKP